MTDFQYYMLAAAIFLTGANSARNLWGYRASALAATYCLIMAIIKWAPHG